MYLSTILLYLARYEIFADTPAVQTRIIVTNVICDIVVYYLFQVFVINVRRTRNLGFRQRSVLFAHYFWMVLFSALMSLVSIYVGFLWTDQHLSLFETARLFIGLNPFDDGRYIGTVFWLVHTTFIPITLFSLVPLVLITSRFAQMIYHQIILNLSRKTNPLLYLAAGISFLVGLKGVFLG
jgi:hypothetical protein